MSEKNPPAKAALPRKLTRREVVRVAALASLATPAFGQETTKEVTQQINEPLRPYGERSGFERSERVSNAVAFPGTGSTRAPLQDMYGIITPSSLFFERLHSGIPVIDPAQHELLIDGLVERPLVFTMNDLHRMQSVSRIHFIECAELSIFAEHYGSPNIPA
jgi:sulfane dehydrogenase subunit SoxC